MYPIAWVVVDKENNDNWDWFCDLLFRDVGVQGGHGWVFILDQQKVCCCKTFVMLKFVTMKADDL